VRPTNQSPSTALAWMAALTAIGGVFLLTGTFNAAPAIAQPATNEPTFVRMVGRPYSRGFPVGEVLQAELGLSRDRLLAVPVDIDKASFIPWLEETDKKLVTISRLRVPRLRPDRPTLDGRDIYDGFFAPAPARLDLWSPLEGSIPRFMKSGYPFQEKELQALDRMLRRCLSYQEQGKVKWYAFPVGSRIAMTSGKASFVEIWINRGPQYASVDETIAKAQLQKVFSSTITDPLEMQALNKHFNYSMVVDDDDVLKNTQGRYHRVCDRLYDMIRDHKYNPTEAL
jgi:hypothetical protein